MHPVTDAAESARARQLRGRLVDELAAGGWIESRQVEEAFRVVPRHLFAPGATLEEAYAADGVVAKRRDANGVTISSVSAPQIQALMLEQARLGPGMRVLEIGSGGYNAALMAELAGPAGEVTTMDVDPDVTGRASRCLAEAGYSRVTVVLADGEDGCAAHAPFDRIVVTAGAWDIPPAWTAQLTAGGTITVPLRMRGLTRSVTFGREDGHLASRSVKVCGFVPMRGAGEHREHVLWLRDRQIALRFDDDCAADPGLLDGVLGAPQPDAWSGLTVGRQEPFDTLQLWLATTLDGFCLLTVHSDLDASPLTPVSRIASPAIADGASFAYLASRRLDETTVELGARGFGPRGSVLAEAMTEQVQVWNRNCRGGPGPVIAAYPAGIPDDRLPDGLVISKRHVRITVSWPGAGRPAPGQEVQHHPQIGE